MTYLVAKPYSPRGSGRGECINNGRQALPSLVRPRGPARGFMVTLSEVKSAITTASHVHRETKKAVPPDRNQAGGALQLFL
jgi:hypothetical protein